MSTNSKNCAKIAQYIQNGRLPIGIRVWLQRLFCASGHDTCAYQILFIYIKFNGGGF